MFVTATAKIECWIMLSSVIVVCYNINVIICIFTFPDS